VIIGFGHPVYRSRIRNKVIKEVAQAFAGSGQQEDVRDRVERIESVMWE
jgi:citrate synthase